jgi:hypothetical protein
MGEAKRKKALAGDLPRRLVAAWQCASEESEAEIFGEVLGHQRPESVMRAAMGLVSRDRLQDFADDMFEVAGNLYPDIGSATDDGLARLHLFTLAVYGAEQHLERLLEPETLGAVAGMLREAGFAHAGAGLVLCPVLLDPVSAAQATHIDVARIARAMVPACLGEGDGASAAVRSVLVPAEPCGDGTLRAVTRMIVGARLLAGHGDAQQDLFDPPDFADEPDHDPGDTGTQPFTAVPGEARSHSSHAEAEDEAKAKFAAAAADMLGGKAIGLVVSGPHAWTKCLGAMGLSRLQGGLMIEAALSGLSLDDASEAHVAAGRDAIHVAVTINDRLIGPVDVPMALASHALEEITDWVDLGFGTVTKYPTLAALTASAGISRN